jgi:peptidoglycan/xylan/chitin deacetylase (PgdA/CDA1 family)
MPLPAEHLEYPLRRHGMDHERYAWSMLTDRPPVRWPGGKPLALWVNVSLEHFPLNPQGQPVKLPGSMTMPYPDLRHFTLRDYGNRVGAWRVLDALDRFGVKASWAVNACLVNRHPQILRAALRRGDEFVGHSWSMDTPHAGGLDAQAEAALIEKSLATLRAFSGQPVAGWLSPGKLQSPHTPELLKKHGIAWFCDWVNDELPYRFHTAEGDLWSLPLATETEDRFVILDNLHSEAEWAQQCIDALDFLLAEAREADAGRLLSLSIHPWVIGQPHRIKHLETVLAHAMAQDGVWNARPAEVLAAFEGQRAVAAG